MLLFAIIGFFAISILGSLFHFVYDWSGKNKVVGFFAAVNESTWEHLKLAFLPTFVWALIGLNFGFNNYATAVFVALFTMLLVIPIIFYSYSHFTKKSVLAIDILSFFIAIGLAMYFAYLIVGMPQLPAAVNTASIYGIIAFVLAFSLFTVLPPKNFLFADPISKKYGFKA